MPPMCGWFSEASNRASRSKRTRRSGSVVKRRGRILIATSRPSFPVARPYLAHAAHAKQRERFVMREAVPDPQRGWGCWANAGAAMKLPRAHGQSEATAPHSASPHRFPETSLGTPFAPLAPPRVPRDTAHRPVDSPAPASSADSPRSTRDRATPAPGSNPSAPFRPRRGGLQPPRDSIRQRNGAPRPGFAVDRGTRGLSTHRPVPRGPAWQEPPRPAHLPTIPAARHRRATSGRERGRRPPECAASCGRPHRKSARDSAT